MNLDQRLSMARQLMLAALPDRTNWSGNAANTLEQRVYEVLAELDAIQAGLWR